MTDFELIERASYKKTVVLAGAAAALLGLGAIAMALAWRGLLGHAFGTALGLGALLCLLLAACGGVVMARHRRALEGAPELYLTSNLLRREEALARADGFRAGALRRLIGRWLLGHDFLVGDEVEVRSLEEILATLDERGFLQGMPFQAEMVKYCGQRLRVFRSVDKIFDYGRTRVMRRLRGCVLLSGLRCDGEDHGGCQARCYLMWRHEWLRRPGETEATASSANQGKGIVAPPRGTESLPDGTTRARFHCQFTQLHSASAPMQPWEIGKELRPLVAGNITLRTWVVGLATRLFNLAQARRGGTAYPTMPPRRARIIPIEPVALAPGDPVLVRPGLEIASTLNEKNKHRGLWFDRDQLKYCGTSHRVLARVERIIDDVHGQMLPMKTPCILLEGVDYSGESLNFSAQHDLFFWREVWLQKVGLASTGGQARGREVFGAQAPAGA